MMQHRLRTRMVTFLDFTGDRLFYLNAEVNKLMQLSKARLPCQIQQEVVSRGKVRTTILFLRTYLEPYAATLYYNKLCSDFTRTDCNDFAEWIRILEKIFISYFLLNGAGGLSTVTGFPLAIIWSYPGGC